MPRRYSVEFKEKAVIRRRWNCLVLSFVMLSLSFSQRSISCSTVVLFVSSSFSFSAGEIHLIPDASALSMSALLVFNQLSASFFSLKVIGALCKMPWCLKLARHLFFRVAQFAPTNDGAYTSGLFLFVFVLHIGEPSGNSSAVLCHIMT